MDSSLSSDGSEDDKALMRYSKASLPAPPPLRPQIARSPEIDETKLAPLPQKPWKAERFPYGFDDSLIIDDLDVVPSPLGRSSDVFDLLHTPVASRRVSLADSHIMNHFPVSDPLGLDTPQIQRIKIEPEEFRLLELKQTDKMAVEASSTNIVPAVKPSIISEKAERKDLEPTTVTSFIAQEHLVPTVQKRLSISSADASETLQPIENAQNFEKTDPQDEKFQKIEEKKRKDSISGKPQVRFDPKNLVISEYSPEELSENCKTLVVIGMAKCPETLNHRTWTEKVFPKISVWFGEYKIPTIDNISLGVIRFTCPPLFRKTPSESDSLFAVRIEGKSNTASNIPFKLQFPRWDRGEKRLRSPREMMSSNKRRFSFLEEEIAETEEQELHEEEELDRRATTMVERVVRLMISPDNSAEMINEISPENGLNFLHTAVFCGASVEVIQMLLSHGADPNVRTGLDGNTALHFACEQGNVSCAKALIKAGATVTALNDKGLTPLDVILSREENEADNELFLLLNDLAPNSPRKPTSPRPPGSSPPRPSSSSNHEINHEQLPTHMKLLRDTLNLSRLNIKLLPLRVLHII